MAPAGAEGRTVAEINQRPKNSPDQPADQGPGLFPAGICQRTRVSID